MRETRSAVPVFLILPSALMPFTAASSALRAVDAHHHGHGVAVYVCVRAVYVVFIHPHALSLSVGLSFSVRIIGVRCSAAVAGWLGWLLLKQRQQCKKAAS